MNIIERLKELMAAATPGPWIVGGSYTVRTMRSALDWIARMRDRHHKHDDEEDKANAALIVAMHNAIPDLIELAEAVKLYKEMAYENHANNYARMCVALAKLEGEV